MALRIFGSISTPCEANWELMEGEGSVRFCKECKLKVYNFTQLSDTEVLAAIEETKDGRLCARIVKRSDGSIATDNCPYKLRRLRNAIRRTAPWVFLVCTFLFRQSLADAQDLVGSPIDPRFGQSNEVGGQLADYSYDTARDIGRIATALSTIPAAIIALRFATPRMRSRWPKHRGCSAHAVELHPQFRNKSWSWRTFFIALIIFWSIPTIIHLIGIMYLNNFGCLGGSIL
jgi:hypothetical protein